MHGVRPTEEEQLMLYGKDLPSGHVRLFSLAPGLTEDELRGKIETFQIKQAPKYEAISYKQGENYEPFVTCVAGTSETRLHINDCLHEALRQLRSIDSPRLLWADEICINEDDAADRSRNVGMIDRIYGSAVTVLIWLDTAKDDSDNAMVFFPEMVNLLSRARSRDELIHPDLRIGAYRTPGLVALNKLLSRIWFTRVWTLQEGTYSSKAKVLCGQREFSFSLLEEFNRHCQEDESGVWTSALSAITSARPARVEQRLRFATEQVNAISQNKIFMSTTGVKEPVSVLLYRLRTLDAYDERDRIYSMWPLLKEEYSPVMKEPRYEDKLSLKDLFQKVSWVEVVHKGNLECLGEAGMWYQTPGIEFPSWVADWSYRNLTHPLWLLNYDCMRKTGLELFCAGKGPSAEARNSADGKILIVTGKFFAEAKDLGEPFSFPTNQAEAEGEQGLREKFQLFWQLIQDRKRQIDACFELVRKYESCNGDVDRDSFCRRALVAGLKPRGAGSGLGDVFIQASDGEIRSHFEALYAFPPRLNEARKVLDVFQDVGKARRFFVTADGRYMGLAPSVALEKDIVVVIYGCSTPFLLRSTEDSDEYILVGECYVTGLMNGEALRMEDILAREIRLR